MIQSSSVARVETESPSVTAMFAIPLQVGKT